MPGSYYNGGDRDDVNNYFSNWGSTKKNVSTVSKPAAITPPAKKFDIPACFDEDFYNDHAHKFSKSSEDYWEWKKFCGYAIAVYSFYRQAAVEFYSKFPPVEKLPDFVDLKLKQENWQEILERVASAENTMVLQFSRSRRTLKAKIDSIKRLRDVRDYAAAAWLMHYASTSNLCVKDAINFKTALNKYNLNDNLDAIKAFRGCCILKEKTKRAIKPDLLTTKMQRSQEIYSDVDATKIFNKLLKSVGGCDLTSYDITLSNIKDKIEDLKADPDYADIIYFYENYGAMLARMDLIKQIERYNGMKNFCVRGENVYETLNDFVSITLNLLDDENKNLNPLFKADMQAFADRADEILKKSLNSYLQSVE